jgi:hypothetical protein
MDNFKQLSAIFIVVCIKCATFYITSSENEGNIAMFILAAFDCIATIVFTIWNILKNSGRGHKITLVIGSALMIFDGICAFLISNKIGIIAHWPAVIQFVVSFAINGINLIYADHCNANAQNTMV